VTLGAKPGVNPNSAENTARAPGRKGYVTGLAIAAASASEMVSANCEIFGVDAGFQMAKDRPKRDRDARPPDSIPRTSPAWSSPRDHPIPFRSSDFTVRRIVLTLWPLREITIIVDGHELTAPTPSQGDGRDPYQALP